jgi:hypothetical protein
VYLLRGKALLAQRLLVKALRDFDIAIRYTDHKPSLDNATAHFYRGQVHRLCFKFDDAISDF